MARPDQSPQMMESFIRKAVNQRIEEITKEEIEKASLLAQRNITTRINQNLDQIVANIAQNYDLNTDRGGVHIYVRKLL